jgi:hypothetical protein
MIYAIPTSLKSGTTDSHIFVNQIFSISCILKTSDGQVVGNWLNFIFLIKRILPESTRLFSIGLNAGLANNMLNWEIRLSVLIWIDSVDEL